MAVYERGRSYRCKFVVDGETYLQTFSERSQAELWEAEVRLALKYGRPLPENNSRTPHGGKLETFGAAYDHTCLHIWDRARGSSSQVIYGRQARDYFGKNKPCRDITREDLQAWARDLFEQGAASATVNRKLAAVSRILSEVPGLTKPKFPRYQEGHNEVRYLSEDDEAKLLATCKHFGLDELHDFTCFQLDTGFRLSETLNLTWDHVTPKTATAWVTKGGKPRTVPLTKRARGILEKRRNLGSPWGNLKVGRSLSRPFRNDWERVQKHTGLGRRIHDLRHTCASRLVQRGVDLLRVKDWMGHKDVKTTLIYAHLAPDNLADCLEALER
jgi:integrase